MGIKISNLPTASETQTTDIVPIVQDGTTKKIQQSILFKNLNDGMADLNNEMTDLDSRLEEAIAEFSTPLKYKGQVQTFNDLPVNADNGDIYSVVSENKNYVWNGTEWIEYSQTINIDDEIKTTLTTQEASEVEITNIAGVNGKIDVSGNSTQETNLSDGILEQGSIYQAEEVESTARVRTKNFTKVVSGSNIVVKADGNFEYMLALYSSSKTFIDNTNSWISVGNSITISSNVGYIRVILKKSDGSDFTPSEIINFNIGPTPSPDYPSEIHNVGDNVNLADESILASYKVNEDDECYIFNNASLYNKNLTSNITFKENTTYILSFIAKQITGNPWFEIIYTDGTSTRIPSSGQKLSTTLSKYTILSDNSKTIDYITEKFQTGSGNPNLYIKKNSFIIREGNVDVSPYSPYNCGNANIEVGNANLLPITNQSFSFGSGANQINVFAQNGKICFNGTGNYEVSSANVLWSSNFAIKLKAGNYKIKMLMEGTKTGTIGIYLKNVDDSTTIQGMAANTTYSFTLTKDTTVCMAFYLSSLSTTNLKFSIMLYKDNGVEENFVPHQEQLITFPFAEGQRLYKGDYLASDGIHHVRKQVVFDGSSDEGWETGNSTGGNYGFVRSDTSVAFNTTNSIIVISNYFKGNTPSDIIDNGMIGICSRRGTGQGIYIRVPNSVATTVAELKTWLQSNPITVEYELAQEEIEPYTEGQEEAYWQLQHCLMYEGYTKVECIDEIKCKFKVEYSYNNELNTTYQGKIDEINEDIHNLDNKVDENINRIENEINTLHSYSTSEQVVGTWIDGSPVYRKVFTIQSFSGHEVVLGTIANINKIISANGSCSNYGFRITIPYSNPNQENFIYLDGTSVKFNSVTTGVTDVCVVLEYTKTS